MSNYLPNPLFAKAQANKDHTHQEIIQARDRIDKRYHDFLIMLPQSVKLSDRSFEITPEQQMLGIYSYERGTYVSIEKPYVTVDGRICMARDEHREAGKQLSILPAKYEVINDVTVVSVTIESEIHGSVTGTIEVGSNGAVDRYNPIANAQTSAIGRALGFMGYGVVGTGIIASSDEIQNPYSVDASSVQQPQQNDNNSGKNRPITYRVQIKEPVGFNPDYSSYVKIQLETNQIATLIMPKEINNFAKDIVPGDVIKVKGWYKENSGRLSATKDVPFKEQRQQAM